ncbi:MAG: hypothetical protein WC600_17245 [Desulfobaccales bacterium]
MAFPATLTNAQDGITDVMAAHLNALEAKVGIDGSLVTTSLDYLVKNPASDNPGHVHSIYAPVAQTMYIGTTAVPINRGTGALALAGITGITPGANFALTQNSVVPLTSVEAGAVVNTLVLKEGKVGIGTATPPVQLCVYGGATEKQIQIKRSDASTLWNIGINAAGALFGLSILNGDTLLQKIDTAGNVLFGGITSAGTSAAKTLGVGSGTAPSTFPADMAQMCVKDQAAGNACFHFYTELGQIIRLYQQAHIADLKADYTAGDLDTEAEMITALNTANAAFNSLLVRLENLGFNATS